MDAMNERERTTTTKGSLFSSAPASHYAKDVAVPHRRSSAKIGPQVRVTRRLGRKGREREKGSIVTYTFNPASPESVYSFSMVLLLPPAPAARAEVGRGAAGARRLGGSAKVLPVQACDNEAESGLWARALTGRHWLLVVGRPGTPRTSRLVCLGSRGMLGA